MKKLNNMEKLNNMAKVNSEENEKSPLTSFEMDLEKAKELKPIENPDSIIGPWFFVHKV